MTRGNDEHNQEEEGDDALTRDLDKIAWLPSVKLGKQPHKPSALGGRLSRKEDGDGRGYTPLDGGGSSESGNAVPPPPPPGYHHVEILPVLPMAMVSGVEDTGIDHHSDHNDPASYHSAGVWEDDSSGPLDVDTAGYLPHTKGHVLAVAAARYKRLYDDLLRLGPSDDRRRFVVAAAHPVEEGVFAEYGLLCQLRDLDEVAAVVASEGEEEREGAPPTLDELRRLVEAFDDDGDADEGQGNGLRDRLLRTHYEATHDVVGRVRIHRLVNPERFAGGDEYLRAEATVLDMVEGDRATAARERRARQAAASGAATRDDILTNFDSGQAERDEREEGAPNAVARAAARIQEELRSIVGEAAERQQPQPPRADPEGIKDKVRAALDDALARTPDAKRTESVALAPKGILVERRPTSSLSPPERALRESFAELVALQHFLKENCRFTRKSVQTFGIGPVGVWLSAAAWGQFVDRRLESDGTAMHAELQEKLTEYLESGGGDGGNGGDSSYFTANSATGENDDGEGEEGATIDFDDLSPALQREFQLVQGRTAAELGPPALERAVQMQRLVQAETYTERLELLQECVENERRRLEAKKMLRSLGSGQGSGDDSDGNKGAGGGEEVRLAERGASAISREEARSVFERLLSAGDEKYDSANEDDTAVFQ